MTENNQIFISNYSRRMWCLVECNKLIRSGVRSGFTLVDRKTNFLALSSLFVLSAPDSFINLFKTIVMTKQTEKSGIVYDSFNDVTWDFSGFFELLADYYNGNLNEMTEQLITAIETLNHMPDDAILSEMAKASTLNLLIVRECLQGIEKPNTN